MMLWSNEELTFSYCTTDSEWRKVGRALTGDVRSQSGSKLVPRARQERCQRDIWEQCRRLDLEAICGYDVAQRMSHPVSESTVERAPYDCEGKGITAMSDIPSDDNPGFVAEEPERGSASIPDRPIAPTDSRYS